MKHNRNPLAKAINYALGAGMIAGLAMTAAPVAAQDDEAADLDRVQVTGSRISRADVEGALPITVIDREAIDRSGFSSVADLLRDTTFNSFGSFRPQSGSSAQSFAEVSLRGLGGERTLVLIDGRRAPRGPMVGGVNDLNAIPLGAVERIEILTDGASAIYGSDAIGGVINIITRSDFEGFELRIGTSDPKRDGGKTRERSVLFGASGENASIIGGVSKNNRSIIFARQRPWSQGRFEPFFSDSPNVSLFGNTYLRFDDFTFNAMPGCNDIAPGLFQELIDSPDFPDETICAYDFSQVSADEAAVSNTAAFTRARYDINNDWSIFANTSVTNIRSFGRYAPGPDFFDLAPSSPNNPTNTTIRLYHRFAALGTRDSYIDSNVYDLLLGVEGRVGDWDLQFGARRNDYRFDEVGYNYLNNAIIQQYLNDGTYDVFDPFNNPEDVLADMRITIGRKSFYVQDEVYASAATDLFDMPAGPVSAFFGFEYREEDYEDRYDQASEAGNVGGSAGNSSGLDRDVVAVYAEFLFPILDNLELNVAGRYDDYSDFGSNFSPKVSLRYQPLDNLTLRASWGEGFRAPTLDLLSQATAFSADTVADFTNCIALGIEPNAVPGQCFGGQLRRQITGFRLANPDLEAEESRQFSFGVAMQPFDFMNFSLDYYNIKVDNRIAFISAQRLVNEESIGMPLPAEWAALGLGVFRLPPTAAFPAGLIDTINTGYVNEGTLETEGLDLNLRTNFDIFGGRLSTQLQYGWMHRYRVDGGRNLLGDPGVPKARGVLSNVYSWGDFALAYNISLVRGTAASTVNVGTTLEPIIERRGHLASWVIHNVQGTYFAPWNGELTLGVQNLWDRDPPLGGASGTRPFDFSLYDQYGRVPYVRYTQRF